MVTEHDRHNLKRLASSAPITLETVTDHDVIVLALTFKLPRFHNEIIAIT